MALFPEKEQTQLPVSEIPEAPEIPQDIETNGVKVVPVNPTVAIPQPTATPQASPAPVAEPIKVPADKTTLTSWSKGDSASALTWLGMFWLRIIKKALRMGRQIIVGGD